jgi:predicted ATPase/class 3 adenylate cyclase/tetratricopeptide (TPR) repeat protein
MLENTAADARALPSGTVAFLFSDIEGSTQRWESHREAMSAAIERHDAVANEAIGKAGGFIFKPMGDGFCAVFRTAPGAIAAALEAQRALAKADFSSVDGLKVRMAVHVGHADERGGDYFGPSVNRVARLLAIGYGGQVLVSGAAADLAQGEMPPQTSLRDLGLHRLKDLAQPEQVYQLVAPDLPQKFFPLRSLDALPNNLPLQLTSFIGRDREIERVVDLLDAHRLVTLVGTGGVGKTRLALQVGADVLDRYEDGVWFIELAPLSDGTLILNELAPLFGVQGSGDRPLLDALLAALRPKHALLIIDNCEHLVDPAAEIIEKVLRASPKIRILATSREALKIAGETVHRVASLDEEAGITLFADRATAASDSFTLTEENTPTVAKICRRLDGIALAIELAAARVRAVDVGELFARLDERFRILTGGSRTALPRQQTMRALIDWSYDLLSPVEQALLRRVAVFSGGWTLDAATNVCAGDELQSWDVVDLLTSLVDKSLVTAELNDTLISGAKLRYRLLESTRQYAAEKLASSGERDRMRRVHAEYFTRVADEAQAHWSTMPTAMWRPPLEAEIDNFRAALDWSVAEKQDLELGGTLASALSTLWRELGVRSEGIRYAESALATEESLSARVRGRLWLAVAALSIGTWAKMRDAADRAANIFAELGDDFGAMQAKLHHAEALTRLRELQLADAELTDALTYFEAASEPRWANHTLSYLARNALFGGDARLGQERFSRVLTAARAQGDERLVAVVMNNLAETEFKVGNVKRAIELGREVIARERIRQDPSSMCFALTNVAAYLTSIGELDEAHGLAIEALRKSLDLQSSPLIAFAVQHLAAIAAIRGDCEKAAILLGFATSSLAKTSTPREFTEEQEYDTMLVTLNEKLGEDRVAELLRRGGLLSEEQAAADALSV